MRIGDGLSTKTFLTVRRIYQLTSTVDMTVASSEANSFVYCYLNQWRCRSGNGMNRRRADVLVLVMRVRIVLYCLSVIQN